MSSLLSKLCLVISLSLSLSLSLSSISAQSFFTVLEKTLDDYDHLDLNYVNYMLASDSRSSGYQIIQIQDPILTATDGQVSFAISDNSIPSQILHSRKVKFDSEGEYRWTGTTASRTFSVSINKGPDGISGNVNTGLISGLARYQILPLEGEEAVLVPVTPTVFTCDLEHDSESAAGAVAIDVCDDDNPDQIDILFLLDPNSSSIYGNNPSGHLNALIAELEDAWINSGITHTVDYTVDIFAPSPTFSLTDCGATATALSNNIEAKRLMDLHGADIVVYLPAEGFIDDIACVAAIGPSIGLAYAIIPFRISLDNYVFTHELGHIFGARHNFVLPGEVNGGRCNFAHNLDLESSTVETIVGQNAFPRILHYSDPDIDYAGVPTGTASQLFDLSQIVTNNAGKIRSAGSTVSDFGNEGTAVFSSNIQVELNAGNECLSLSAAGNIPTAITIPSWTSDHSTTYDWFWSYDGLFTNGANFTYLGSGAVLDIPEPETDYCRFYFIKLVVNSNFSLTAPFSINDNQVLLPITSSVVSLQGGRCAPNTHVCPTSGPSGSSFFMTPSSTNIESLNSEGHEDIIQKENKVFQVFNVQGAYIGSVANREEIFNMNLVTGIYLIRSEDNQDYQTEKIFITNDN